MAVAYSSFNTLAILKRNPHLPLLQCTTTTTATNPWNRLQQGNHGAIGSKRWRPIRAVEKEDAPPKGEEEEEEEEEEQKKGGGKGFVAGLESVMAKSFGGSLWFSVLVLSLALFAGAYIYLVISFGDLSDIPIIRGPSRLTSN